MTFTVPGPKISHASQSHKTWRTGSKLARLAHRSKKSPLGTTFAFTLNEPAKVSFTFFNGHKPAGAFSFNAKGGKHKLTFQGHLSRHKKLAPGSYTVAITARIGKAVSKPVTLKFTIARH